MGARCAGSSAAMLLARRGARVLMLDRSRFPSDTVSTHFLHPAGACRLEEWGLLGPLLKTGCPPIPTVSFHLADDVVVSGAPLAQGSVTTCVAPRRIVLDELLVDAAADAGVEFLAGASFQAPVVDGDGRVAGVTYRCAGRSRTAYAPLVIGADGRHSALARAVGAVPYRDLGVISCLFYGYWSGLPDKGSQVYMHDGVAVVAFPTHHGQHCVVVGWPRDRFDAVRRDIDRQFMAAVRKLAPEVHEGLVGGERHGRIVGAGNLANVYRTSAGPGWTLVGDAGLTKDPASAQGIGDAFTQSVSLAEKVAAALGEGPGAVDQAVAAYAEERNRCTTDAFETNAAFATWTVPNDLLAVLREAQHEPERVTAFLGVYAGRIRLADFLAGNAGLRRES
ncbi:NAD(P)/FAD-dependent oxidoreductase [Streptomyces fagopyri]|uniref:NAD(P)/FAD-dependent oxidoreductase n=1 Tax=Streptomyces fagopyri TaxID=2662397 RepID=UPI00371346B7